MRRPRRPFLSVAVVLAAACVHVPKEAPELSRQVEGRMLALRSAHLATVRAYVAAKRVQVDRFVAEQWVPAFTQNVLSSGAVQSEIAKATTPARQVELFSGLGLRIQKQIDGKRTEMMRPLDELERQLVGSVQTAYDEALAANSALTALLEAHADTTQKKDELLQRFAIDEKLSAAFEKAERVVGLMTAGKDAFEQNRARIEELLGSFSK